MRWIVLLAFFAACGSGSGSGAEAESEAEAEAEAESEAESEAEGGPDLYPWEFEIGSGDPQSTLLDQIPEDGSFTLMPGPQGGFHIYVQVRASGINPTYVAARRRVIDPASGLVLREQRDSMGMVEVDDGVWSYSNVPQTFMCPSLVDGWAMYDTPFDLEVRLEDTDGVMLWARVPIVLRCPDSKGYCLSNNLIGCAAP